MSKWVTFLRHETIGCIMDGSDQWPYHCDTVEKLEHTMGHVLAAVAIEMLEAIGLIEGA